MLVALSSKFSFLLKENVAAVCQLSSSTFTTASSSVFVSPAQLSGSAVETLFSQFKHTAGGKFSVTNYLSARAANLIKHCMATVHSSLIGYRDTHSKPDLISVKILNNFVNRSTTL